MRGFHYVFVSEGREVRSYLLQGKPCRLVTVGECLTSRRIRERISQSKPVATNPPKTTTERNFANETTSFPILFSRHGKFKLLSAYAKTRSLTREIISPAYGSRLAARSPLFTVNFISEIPSKGNCWIVRVSVWLIEATRVDPPIGVSKVVLKSTVKVSV